MFNLFGDCTDNSCDGTLLVLTGEMSCGALDRDPLYLASAEVTCFFARDGARLATAGLHVVRCCAIIVDKLATMWATPRRSEGVAGGWRGRRGVGAA